MLETEPLDGRIGTQALPSRGKKPLQRTGRPPKNEGLGRGYAQGDTKNATASNEKNQRLEPRKKKAGRLPEGLSAWGSSFGTGQGGLARVEKRRGEEKSKHHLGPGPQAAGTGVGWRIGLS